MLPRQQRLPPRKRRQAAAAGTEAARLAAPLPHSVALLRHCCAPSALLQVIEGISRVLGPKVWDNVVLGFTRASESSAPGGLDFATHVEQRAAALRAAIKKVWPGAVAAVGVSLCVSATRGM